MFKRQWRAFCWVCGVASALCIIGVHVHWPSGDGGGAKAHRQRVPALLPAQPIATATASACVTGAAGRWPAVARGGGRVACLTERKAVTQDDVSQMGRDLTVNYAVVSNIQMESNYSFQVRFTNNGSNPVGGAGWEIYFCNIHMLFPEANLRNNRSQDVGHGIGVSHVNGCLFRLSPLNGSVTFESGKPVVLDMVAENWMVAKSDVMPNWYVAAPGLLPARISNTVTEVNFIGPFNGAEKYKRRSSDRYNPIAPHERYGYYQQAGSPSEAVRPVPKPRAMNAVPATNGGVSLDAVWLVQNDGQLLVDFPMTHAFVHDTIGGQSDSTSSCEGRVCLHFVKNGTLSVGSYQLQLASRTLEVQATDDSSALAAARTLYQLKFMKARFSSLTLEDSPRYAYRGAMLDIVRNFQTVDTIKRLIDVVSLYKINYLHLRLGDDEGWRLDIGDLPELTEVASKTCYDPTETKCILPEFGAAPDSLPRFLTKTQYKELLVYATGRDVQVIPEFDMPGHSRAAIKAMEARYRRLASAGNMAAAELYLLSDLNDTSVYRSVQLYTDNAMNPCLNSTYRFIEKVLLTVQGYHNETGRPLTFIHMGGDEVPEGAWMNSSVCQPLLASSIYSKANYLVLKKKFVQNVYALTSEAGLGLAMWEDAYMDGEPYSLDVLAAAVPSGQQRMPAYAYVWQNVWEWGAAKRAYQLANAGYKVILMPATHFYFDHPQEPDPEERGFYWATRFTGTNKTFGFMPGNIYANINHDLGRFGAPLSRAQLCKDERLDCPPLDRAKAANIIGIQGGVFAETCRSEQYLHEFMFPRILALAERAWHEADWEQIANDTSDEYYAKRREDWQSFAAAIGRHQLPMLADKNVTFHLNPPGVTNDGMWKVNTEFPGQAVEYSVDGEKQWIPFDGSQPSGMTSDHFLTFATVAKGPMGTRRSRAIKFAVSGSPVATAKTWFCLTIAVLVSVLLVF